MRALLVLSDGKFFLGKSIGYDPKDKHYHAIGEVVFNTSMTGYQEILTDPSYHSQMITLTYPHIGNVGINACDQESSKIHAAALIIRDYPQCFSNWRANESLSEFLVENKCVGISEIDTRALTRHLRGKGAQNGVIVLIEDNEKLSIETLVQEAIQKANEFNELNNVNLAQKVSTTEAYEWQEGEWDLKLNAFPKMEHQTALKVVALDFGIKQNILRMLAQRGCHVTVMPHNASAEEILAYQPDGIFLSNGPGDPQACKEAIETIKQLLAKKIPIFGICLGHQLLGLASGAQTKKMKTGHHGANHPVFDTHLQQVKITSQNHGFAIDSDTLPSNVRVFAHSLFDQTIQGIELTDSPAFGFQGHPEASPGPCDLSYLFDRFIKLIHDSVNSSR